MIAISPRNKSNLTIGEIDVQQIGATTWIDNVDTTKHLPFFARRSRYARQSLTPLASTRESFARKPRFLSSFSFFMDSIILLRYFNR